MKVDLRSTRILMPMRVLRDFLNTICTACDRITCRLSNAFVFQILPCRGCSFFQSSYVLSSKSVCNHCSTWLHPVFVNVDIENSHFLAKPASEKDKKASTAKAHALIQFFWLPYRPVELLMWRWISIFWLQWMPYSTVVDNSYSQRTKVRCCSTYGTKRHQNTVGGRCNLVLHPENKAWSIGSVVHVNLCSTKELKG